MTFPGEVFVLHPGQFAPGTTLERIAIPDDILGKLEGKSTLGRLGLMIHSTAGYVDPGWDGELTLEFPTWLLFPLSCIRGCASVSSLFERMSSPVERPYGSEALGSHYQGQRGLHVSCPSKVGGEKYVWLNELYHSLNPVAISIGPLSIRWYGLASCWLYFGGRYALPYGASWKLDITVDDTLNLLIGAFESLSSSPVLRHLLWRRYYLQHPWIFFAFSQGGMSFHGGLVGAVVSSSLVPA